MSCDKVQEQISSLLDRKVAAGEEKTVLAHIGACRVCGERYEAMLNLRAALRRMDRAAMPAGLPDRLRVLASHESARRIAHANVSARLKELRWRALLAFDNMMRPVALPFAGGLFAATLLFSMLVPSLSFAHNFFGDEPPAALYTYPEGRVVGASGYIPKLEVTSSPRSEMDTVLELTIDERGRVADYSVENGTLTPDMESLILFSTFTPATVFGQPTWSKVQVFFHNDYSVTVRG
jgi:anti-sigma factor RsiW